jgi:hypothetical protein
LRSLLAALMMLTLAGCATTDGRVLSLTNGKPVTETLVLSKCPALKKYSKEQLEKAAIELQGMVPDSVIAKMVVDYGQLREACRAIQKKLKG